MERANSEEQDLDEGDDLFLVTSAFADDARDQERIVEGRIARADIKVDSFDKVFAQYSEVEKEVNEIYNISNGFEVLEEHGWDKASALEAIVIGKDIKKVVVECSTPAPCQICTETRTDYFGMECGHMFCGSCWKRYISSNLFMLPMICMQNGCKQRVIFDFVYKNITDEQLRLRYKRERLIAFLDSHRLGSQCVNLECDNIMRISPGLREVGVQCRCGAQYCFACKKAPHAPASCAMIERWQIRFVNLRAQLDQKQFKDYQSAHTRSCPGCKAPTEKAGGCNYLRCVCGVLWCWQCSQRIESARGNIHKCPAFSLLLKVNRDGQKEVARMFSSDPLLDSFAESYLGYDANTTSAEAELAYSSHGRARDSLRLCREGLKNMYVFLFYLKMSPSKSHLFTEFSEQRFELATNVEQLSSLLQESTVKKGLAPITANQRSSQIVDLADICIKKLDLILNSWMTTDLENIDVLETQASVNAKPAKPPAWVEDDDAEFARALQQSLEAIPDPFTPLHRDVGFVPKSDAAPACGIASQQLPKTSVVVGDEKGIAALRTVAKSPLAKSAVASDPWDDPESEEEAAALAIRRSINDADEETERQIQRALALSLGKNLAEEEEPEKRKEKEEIPKQKVQQPILEKKVEAPKKVNMSTWLPLNLVLSPQQSPYTLRLMEQGMNFMFMEAASNKVVLACKGCKIIRMDLSTFTDREEIVVLRKQPDYEIQYISLDPSGNHLLIVVGNDFINELYYLHWLMPQPKVVPQAMGLGICAIGWDPKWQNINSGGVALLGTSKGIIYESTFKCGLGDMSWHEICRMPGKIQEIKIDKATQHRPQWVVMVLTTYPNRFYQFTGTSAEMRKELNVSADQMEEYLGGECMANRPLALYSQPYEGTIHCAWVTCQGVYSGTLVPGAKPMLRKQKLAYSSSPLAIAMLRTQDIFLLLHDRIHVISKVSGSVVWEETFPNRANIGKLLSLCQDASTGFIWLVSEQCIWQIVPASAKLPSLASVVDTDEEIQHAIEVSLVSAPKEGEQTKTNEKQ